MGIVKRSVTTQFVIALVAVLVVALSVISIRRSMVDRSSPEESVSSASPGNSTDRLPLGLHPVTHPPNNLPTPEKRQLGRRLFFDTRLSKDRTLSCASCHDPAHGLSIGERFASGVGGHKGTRHPPTLVNVAFNSLQFWDGRIGELGQLDSLERQALVPIQDIHEMNLDPVEAAHRLADDPQMRAEFQAAFQADPSSDLIAKAIAVFERSLLFGDSPFDRFQAGQKTALSAGAKRGHDLFFWKATCSACHSGPNFTDNAFHPSVAETSSDDEDLGREKVTGDPADRKHFKTPTLREVAHRTPFMHNGSLRTLEEVVDRYDRGGFDTHYWPPENLKNIERLMTSNAPDAISFRKNAAPRLRSGFPLQLTTEEKRDIVTFLREGLTSLSPPLQLGRQPKP